MAQIALLPRFLLMAGIGALLYSVLALAVFWFQDRLIFVGATWGRGEPLPPAPGVEILRLPLGGGATFRAAATEPPSARAVLVFFGGNGEDLRSGIYWASLWTEYGLATLVVEYPGYGDSDGTPSMKSFFTAADAAADHAAQMASRLRVPLYAGGSSLGSFSAIHLAANSRVEKLLLIAPMTTLAAAARTHYPWLPINFLLRHRFNNLDLADHVHCPTLILHGDRDTIIPQSHGRELATRLACTAQFLSAPNHGHNDLPCHHQGPFGATIAAFLTP